MAILLSRCGLFDAYIEKSTVIDTDLVLDLFSDDRKKAIENFKAFHEIISNDVFLDIEENKRLTDDEALEMIKKIGNVHHSSDIQILEKEKRNQCLKTLKEKGLSTRQIARLTGVSRGIILKV